jgi:hypothetical protein
MNDETFLSLADRELRRLKALADKAMAQVDDDGFFAALGQDENSIALVVKHMAGNLRSRFRDFLTSDGEKPDRNRDAEFETAPTDTRAALLAAWEEGWQILFDALAPLGEADLTRVVTIRGEPLSVFQAVGRQLTHYAYHVGQIVLLARHWAGPEWSSLSIPRGKSADFNRRPASYIAPTSRS